LFPKPIDPFGGGKPKHQDDQTGETDARTVHSATRIVEKEFKEFKEFRGEGRNHDLEGSRFGLDHATLRSLLKRLARPQNDAAGGSRELPSAIFLPALR
jgi:hypothetical protein